MSLMIVDSNLYGWRTAVIWSASLGCICGLVGVVLGVLSLIGLSSAFHLLDNVSALSLVTAFLALAFAAHSFDKAHEVENQLRIERCKKAGMKVDDK